MKTAAAPQLTIEDIFGLVQADLKDVEAGLRRKVATAIPIVDEINTYIHDSGGKRLRPTIALLCSKLCGYEGPDVSHLGVILELIHVATLVHDDIIDNARFRRGRPAVHTKWGQHTTVLMGDWLYMTSFHLALDYKDMRILDSLINITRNLVEGELMQLEQNGRLDLTREEQLAICVRKTAYLFGGCCQLAAIVARQDQEVVEKLWRYGHSFGIAFQLIDDLLDYTSTAALMGKPNLKDLEEGRVTLPIIYLLQRADRRDADFVRRVVKARDFSLDNKKRIIDLTRSYETLDDVRKEAQSYAMAAKESLSDFPDSVYRQALLHLPQFVLERQK